MRLRMLTALLTAALFTLALVAGCGSDKSSNPIYGSLNDPAFAPVKTRIDSTLISIYNDLQAGLGQLKVQPGDTTSVGAQLTPPAQRPDSTVNPNILESSYSNGWHYVYAEFYGDEYTSVLYDSVQYQVDGRAVKKTSVQVDYVHFITNWELNSVNVDASHIDYTGRSDFEFNNLDQATGLISGTSSQAVDDYYIDTDTTFTKHFAFTFTVSNYQIDHQADGWISACPTSGSVSFAGTYSWSWANGTTSGEGSSEWTADISFNNGDATVTASNGTTSWHYTMSLCNVVE